MECSCEVEGFRDPRCAERGMCGAPSLQDQLDELLNSKPETGEQWAEICRLEAEIIAQVKS